MTALAYPALAPTGFERALLAGARVLIASADARMQRRAASRVLRDLHIEIADAQRDQAAPIRLGMLPR